VGEVSNGFAHFVFKLSKDCRKAAQRIAWGRLCAGPNHELTLVMTKERAGVMAKTSILPLMPSVKPPSSKARHFGMVVARCWCGCGVRSVVQLWELSGMGAPN
jgi:hypothetical protein